MPGNLLLFYVFGAVAVISTLLVIAQSNPIYSVLLLIASFIGLAGLYVLLEAPFVAVIQIIVYAGAIMVLFLFVVMLLNAPHEDVPETGDAEASAGTRFIGALLALALVVELMWALSRSTVPETGSAAGGSWSVADIGQLIFQRYGFAFEATSILILVAMVGAVTVAGRHLSERPAPPNRGDSWPS